MKKTLQTLLTAVSVAWLSGTTVNAASLPDGLQGMNWASQNIGSTHWPDGLNASQSYGDQYAVGQKMGNAVKNAGGLTIRMPIDSYLSTGYNWYLYAGAINGVCSTGCKVIICYWLPSGSTVSDVNAWYAIWAPVNTSFGSSAYVKFEPVNEPTYSTDSALADLYAGFLTHFSCSSWKCILDGNNVATICYPLGNDSRLNNQYLGLHMYSWFHGAPYSGGGASWQGYYDYCAYCVGNHAWRTVITETGVQTDGRSPAVPFWQQWRFGMDPDQAAFSGVLAWARDNNVATVAYSGINNGDGYHWFKSDSNLTEVNTQVCDMFRWSWKKKNAVAAGTYRLLNRADGKYLDNLGATTDGANVGQWASGSSNNQKWKLTQQDSVWFKLQCVTGGKYLDCLGHTADGSAIGQWSAGGSWNQYWAISATDSGYYQIINRATGKCLDTGGQTANGAVMQNWGSGTSYNQQWKPGP